MQSKCTPNGNKREGRVKLGPGLQLPLWATERLRSRGSHAHRQMQVLMERCRLRHCAMGIRDIGKNSATRRRGKSKRKPKTTWGHSPNPGPAPIPTSRCTRPPPGWLLELGAHAAVGARVSSAFCGPGTARHAPVTSADTTELVSGPLAGSQGLPV